MAASVNDLFRKGAANFSTTLASQKAAGASTASLSSTTGIPTSTGIEICVGRVDANGNKTPALKAIYKGTLAGTTVSNLTLVEGTDQLHAAGTPVEIIFSASQWNDAITGILAQHNQDGTHGAVTGTSATWSGTVTASNFVQTGGSGANGWTVGLATPNTVTANGNRSYDLVFNGTDLTGTLSPGMRLRTTRTVAAPTQSTSLNGSSQYYTKSSPSGMTNWTGITIMAWVKPTAYQTGFVIGRDNGSFAGWSLRFTDSGQPLLGVYNNTSGNYREQATYQSVPLNKWTHVAFTWTGTTFVSYIDGISVPNFQSAGAGTPGITQPTTPLFVGAKYISSAGNYFVGKLSQVAVFSAALSQSTVQSYMSQGLAGTETSLVSAYSLSNSVSDLSSNGNNLTANGSATTTNADSPFGGQADGTISSTLDYAIVTKTAFSTNTTVTVQVPEGCTIPTSGGVSAVSYSTQKAPYGMPVAQDKWLIIHYQPAQRMTNTVNNAYVAHQSAPVPAGSWKVVANFNDFVTSGAVNYLLINRVLSASSNSLSWFTGGQQPIGVRAYIQASTSEVGASFSLTGTITVDTQTTLYGLQMIQNASGTINVYALQSLILLENAYL